MYDKLVTQLNAIDTGKFVLKTQYDTDKSSLENINDADKKIPDISSLVRKTHYNAEITGIVGKIPNITGLATTADINAAKNKLPNDNDLVKKTDYDAKIKGIESKYFTTSDCIKFTRDIVDAKVKKGIS